MRLTHVEHHVEQQLVLMKTIGQSYENLVKNGMESVTSQRINVRLSALKDNWDKFCVKHDAITLAVKQLNDNDRESIMRHSYFKDNLFSVVNESYLESVERFNSALDSQSEYGSIPGTSSSRHVSESTSEIVAFINRSQLPRYDIPKFNGNHADWLYFKDLFTSLVINNSSLTNIERLQYLKTSLTGSAYNLLKNTMLTGGNFSNDWKALVSFYEDKRMLVNSARTSLFSLKPMTKSTAGEMEKLFTGVMETYRTLDTLGRPIHHWDDILIFMVIQRLDSDTVNMWDLHRGPSNELPTWKQFEEFFRNRLMNLKGHETRKGKFVSQLNPSSVKSHYQGKNKTVKSCSFCSENHWSASCPQYVSKTVQQRVVLVQKHNLCFNCLGPHRASACRITTRCRKCAGKHHTTLHRSNLESTKSNSNSAKLATGKPNEPTTTKPDNTETTTGSQVLHSALGNEVKTPYVLLATALVTITSEHGNSSHARILIDQGSEVSLITERLVQRLRLPRTRSHIPLIGIGGVASNRTKGMTSFSIKPHFKSSFQCSIAAHILPKLTSTIPSVSLKNHGWSHLDGIQLADPNYLAPGSIDVILGADVFGQIIQNGIRKGSNNAPMAQATKLGWIISGPTSSQSTPGGSQSFHVSLESDLFGLMRRFWELDEIAPFKTSSRSTDEQACEEHFKSTHSRTEHGRYVVRLPLKEPVNKLGDSKAKAVRLIKKLSCKFSSNSEFSRLYADFIDEYEKLNHMKIVPKDTTDPPITYYLPHHGVLREHSLTTRLRVVFNGSSPTTSGHSLNDLLHTGAKLQTDLFDVLIWFRLFRYVFSTDIEKMFRQINVQEDDWDLQRILWIDNEGHLRTYHLTTVTYGLACAPFLALRTLQQLIEDEGTKFPLAVPSLSKGRYVDDIFGGADTLEQAQEIVRQLNQLCMAGGFKLQKWVSNDSSMLSSVSTDKQNNSKFIEHKENLVVYTLGLGWQPSTDTFIFKYTLPAEGVITKRSTLSTIAKLFDPLGFLSPITITGKLLIQELWTIKLGWDDPLPDHVASKWITFIGSLQDTPKFTLPRWIGCSNDRQVEIHGFCDASQQAMAAVVYLRTSCEEEAVNIRFVASKTKVAPLKRLTVPRLELSGAVLLTKLVSHLLHVLEWKNLRIILWTDSSITHTWLNSHPSRWKDFVYNRVCHIQETIPQAEWRFVPGTDNPADFATRGLTTSQLSELSSWWCGPSWLSQPSSAWPRLPTEKPIRENLEERPTKVLSVNTKNYTPWDLINRYSSLVKLYRITATCQRAVSRFKRCTAMSTFGPLTTQELVDAKFYWVKEIQRASFQGDLQLLSKGRPISKSSPLVRLTPFLDAKGLLRVGGRLQFSSLSQDEKHPLILPRESTLTSLIIRDAHLRTLHGGTQITLSLLRSEYWIIGGRAPVRSLIIKCVKCARYRQTRAKQLMGQLPATRVSPNRPFEHTGIDYAGPFVTKTWKGKNARTYKSYIAVFVCFSTSAVHLELVTDYTAEAFIAAYKRFTSRRGICVTLSSDCGTTLKGSDAELRRLFSQSTEESTKLATLLANDGTQWKFNPPSAPHFGGKWEAGVKSVKYHLRRVIGDTLLTYEEMTTLLSQVESVLNSRPLCPLTDDPDDLNALTPGHFLLGSAPVIVPEPSLDTVKLSRLSRWQLVRQKLESFWSQWSKECLQRYLSVYKWNRVNKSLEKGTLVLVVYDRYPPSKWPLGRIIQTHPGKDGHTRVVTIQTQTSVLTRPIAKVCPLPIEQDTL
ncbi:uncharacterized protein LOC120358020 [Solenopsis invicta]|nr:uncharacterized protein LOC120358020 [Solenopsis invicta]